MNRLSSEGAILRTVMACALLVMVSGALAQGRSYNTAYDYPGLGKRSVGFMGSLSEPWRDFDGRVVIPTQQGVDFPQSYRPELVGFRQGPPQLRIRYAHSQYEFLHGLAVNCTQSILYPCGPSLFSDRFEAP